MKEQEFRPDSRATYFYRTARLLLVLILASFVNGAQAKDPMHLALFDAKRRVKVADSIQMTRFADGLYELGVPSRDMLAEWSPDRRHFTVVLRRGNLEHNTNEYSLVLFAAADIVKSKPRHQTLVRIASSSNLPGISHVKWLNNETLTFLGEGPEGLQQLYSVNRNSRRPTRLIGWRTNVTAYDATADLREIVFIAEEPARTHGDEEGGRRGLVISTLPLAQVLGIGNFYGHRFQLFSKTGHDRPRQMGIRTIISGYEYPIDRWKLSISPDRRHALMEGRVVKIPEAWKEYTNETVRVLTRANEEGPKTISNYLLIDLMTGSMKPLLNTPNQDLSNYVWSPDSHSIVASNIFLPLAIPDVEERRRRQAIPYVAEVKLTGEVVPITDRNMKVVRWSRESDDVLLRSQDGVPFLYRKGLHGWQEVSGRSGPEGAAEGLDITLEESANVTPKIIATLPQTHQQKVVLDLNPQFAALRFAKVEIVRFKSADGHEVEGGLYLPPDHAAGTTYPLVIQTHGFDPSRFHMDGPSTTGFAAQALAGNDIAVLQIGIDKGEQSSFRNPTEPEHEMAVLEGAIDYLDDRGLIDRKRVGLVGFSRTCYHVLFTLTHSKYHFAAAAVSDGVDGGYFQYVLGENLESEITSWFDVVNLGSPFGSKLLAWFQRAPGFNIDKVDTPVRIEALGLDSVLSEWEWVAGLKRLGKPVEGILIRNASHNLQRPWDRLISQGGNVDWFRFWLKGEEDPDVTKGEQYQRWRELRNLSRVQLTQRAMPPEPFGVGHLPAARADERWRP